MFPYVKHRPVANIGRMQLSGGIQICSNINNVDPIHKGLDSLVAAAGVSLAPLSLLVEAMSSPFHVATLQNDYYVVTGMMVTRMVPNPTGLGEQPQSRAFSFIGDSNDAKEAMWSIPMRLHLIEDRARQAFEGFLSEDEIRAAALAFHQRVIGVL